MYKTRLQELCQKKGWVFPEYETVREGPGHNSRFQSTVTVNGQLFTSRCEAKSSKLAQNDAACLAFHHFSSPSPGIPCETTESNANLSAGGMFNVEVSKVNQTQQNIEMSRDIPIQEVGYVGAAAITKNDDIFKGEMPHLCKNHLQMYAQKNHLPLPIYSCERIGPPHASRFKCKVTINGQTYESPYLFSTVKEAESAAAKAALMSLSFDAVKGDECSYKNLLQELAQREGFHLPTYSTSSSGQAHMPMFVSTVEIDGQTFTGEGSKSKKAAEISAAKVAYTAIKSRNLSETHVHHSPVHQLGEALQCSSPSLLGDLASYFQQNVQPKMPLPSEAAERAASVDVASSLQVTLPARESIAPRNGTSSESVSEQGSSSSPGDSPTTSVINSCIKHLIEQSALCRKGVIIHSRQTRVAYPNGSTPSPLSNENWVVADYSP